MVLSMVSIRLAQGLIAPHPSDAVFYNNPPPRERPVIHDVLGWPVFTARFAARTGTQALGVQFVDPYVGQIADAAHALRQPIEQSRLLQHANIGGRAYYAVGHIH